MLLAAIALLAYVSIVNNEPGAIEKTAVLTLMKNKKVNERLIR